MPDRDNIVEIDATKPAPAPETGHLNMGGRNPLGVDIGVTSRWLTRGGKPWFPVMGEFQFSRYPEAFWEDEILKMKSAGISVVASYVFWIHHEEREGVFDWSGARNLRAFVGLCAKHGMLFFLRPGPWVHGECRNGGFPDWLAVKCGVDPAKAAESPWGGREKPLVRSNAPKYIEYAARYFREVGSQVRGLFWRDGGPIIGIQLENEYMFHGTGAGAAHILKLKELARDAGMEAPLWTVTGWGKPEYPEREVMAVFGMYPDHFWEGGLDDLPQDNRALFEQERNDPGIGADLSGKMNVPEESRGKCIYPYATCEMGGGIQVGYLRRPLVLPEQGMSMNMVRLGSGVKMQGYYVFHGGTNPRGALSTMHESQATGYWNDCPTLSYDFQAPISEYGVVREVAHALRPMHTLLGSFGTDMATTEPCLPGLRPRDWKDASVPRVSARMDGERGFIFVNNYQRFLPLPERKGFQVELSLPGGRIAVPSGPTAVPAGACFIWPVNMDLGAGILRHATAQPLCRIDDGGIAYFFFKEIPGIRADFCLRKDSLKTAEGTGEKVETGETVEFIGVPASRGPAVRISGGEGRRTVLVLLSDGDGMHCHVASIDGKTRAIITYADPLVEDGRIRLRSRSAEGIGLLTFPPLPEGYNPKSGGEKVADGIFRGFRCQAERCGIGARLEKARDGKPARAPLKGIKGCVEAVGDADFEDAGAWRVLVSGDIPAGVSEVYLAIDYVGDAARLYIGGELVADDFHYGRLWEPGLRRLSLGEPARELEIRVVPLRKDAPIYMDKTVRPVFGSDGQAGEMRGVKVIPEYEVELIFGRQS